MNKLTKLLTLAWMLLIGNMASAQVTVTVYLTDNTTAAVDVDASGAITFTEDNLTVMESTLTGATTSWAIDNISKVTFDGDVNTEGIGTVIGDGLSIYPNPVQEKFTIQGIGNTTTVVTIFNIAGVKMLEQPCTEGSTIDVSELIHGIYFVRVGSQTLKMAKK